MGSSDARKSRRKHEHESSNSDHSIRKKQRTNRGRTDYRNVTRTSKRPVREEEDFNESHDEEEESEIESDSENSQPEAVDENGKAYDALLNLLNAEQESSGEESEELEDEEHNGEDEDSSEVEAVNGEEDDGEDEETAEEEEEDHVAGVVSDDDDEEEENTDNEDIDSDDEQLSDPFEYHFGNSSPKYLQESLKALETEKARWKSHKRQTEGYSDLISLPPVDSSSKYLNIPKDHSFKDYNIKSRILEPFKTTTNEEFNESLIAKTLLDPIFSYNDVLFPYDSIDNINDYRKLYALHSLNHVFKTRDRILKNTTRLHAQNEKVSEGKLKPEDEKEFRDQGFTRPKVLILLPTRHHCYQVVKTLMDLSGSEQIENLKKFKGQFYEDSEAPEQKPDDFKNLFEGNTNDFFCLGIKFTRKSLKLYSSFYNSDIILASPIGLQLILEHPDKKKRQTDFLSSIELFIVDQAHAIELQNWDHVLTILKYLNKVPKELHDTDFSRVRMWSIEDQAQYFTQSLVFTQYTTPNINNLLTRSKNIFGKQRFRILVPKERSAVSKVGVRIKQIFTRFQSVSPFEEPNERFNHFKSVIVPALSKATSYDDGLLIYIPQYTDFLRIKNYLHEKTSLSFCDANEYSEQKDLTRSRALFQQGRRKILLYTERLHHYKRFELKGVKNILLYGVPTNPSFYTEIVLSIARSVYEEAADFDLSSVRCLYSKWDALALERVVGTERSAVLTHGQNEFYEFR